MFRSIQALIERLEKPLVERVQGPGGWANETPSRKRLFVTLILAQVAVGVLVAGWLTQSALFWIWGAAAWVLMAFFVIGLSTSPIATMKRTVRFLVWGAIGFLSAYVLFLGVLVAT